MRFALSVTAFVILATTGCQKQGEPQTNLSASQAEAPERKHYEYLYRYSDGINPTTLNQLGNEGWELVAIIPPFEVGNKSNQNAQYIFKRVK